MMGGSDEDLDSPFGVFLYFVLRMPVISFLLNKGSMGPVVMTPTPDGNLNYNDLLHTTSKLFQFPETSNTETSEKLEGDSEVGIKS
ncbi:hypothetical protein Hanom_Chr07g00614891 [Helianthus anomalus]